jgi:hypothetical protein
MPVMTRKAELTAAGCGFESVAQLPHGFRNTRLQDGSKPFRVSLCPIPFQCVELDNSAAARALFKCPCESAHSTESGNSIMAFPMTASTICHSIRPELLLFVTPRVPATNGPLISTDSMSVSKAQLLTVVQNSHANGTSTPHSTEC